MKEGRYEMDESSTTKTTSAAQVASAGRAISNRTNSNRCCLNALSIVVSLSLPSCANSAYLRPFVTDGIVLRADNECLLKSLRESWASNILITL